MDEDSGLYYFNARWYDASLGRFITEDPARDGDNWVAYVSNNPLAYTDPTGLADKPSDTAQLYYLVYSIDLPGRDPTSSVVSPVKDNLDAGHVFVSLVQIDTAAESLTTDSAGLYPAGSEVFHGSVDGKVVDDSTRHADKRFVMEIDAKGYERALGFINDSKENPPDYDLLDYNCVDFARDIGERAGVDLPDNLTPSGADAAMEIEDFFGGAQ